MSRSCFLAAVAVAVTATATNFGRATDYTWSNAAGGNWSVAGNWTPGIVPTATDNATLGVLSATYAVTLNDTRSITNLTINNAQATFNESANLTVGGTFAVTARIYSLTTGTLTLNGMMTTGTGATANWTGGTVTGTGTLAGTLVVSGGSGGESISGTTLQNGGTLAWASGTIAAGTNGATLTNLPAGVIDFRADGVAFANGGGLATTFYGNLTNQGILRKSAGTASNTSVQWAVDFRGGGTVDGQTGTLNFDAGGTLNSGTTTITGAGLVALDGGTFAVPSGATFTAAGSGGSNLHWTGGTLAGPAAGAGTLAGTLVVSGGSGGESISGTTLQSGGTLAWASGTIAAGTNGATLTNLPAGVIDFRADGVAFANGGGLATTFYGNLTNQGILRKSAGTASNTSVQWAVDFRGGGTVDGQTGTLNFDAGGTLNSGTTTITGAGLVALDGGTFAVPSGATFTAAGSGGSNLHWTGGTLAGPAAGAGTLAGTLVVSGGSGGESISGTTLQSGGTLAWASGTIAAGTNGATLTNLPAGVIDFRADGVAFANGGGLATTFYGNLTNQGILRKSAGTASNTSVQWAVDFRGGGTVDGQTGTLNFDAGGTLNSGTTTITGAGLVALDGGTFAVPSGATFTAAGSGGSNLHWTGGTLAGPAAGAGTLAGTLVVSGGSGGESISGTTLQSGGTLAWASGTIAAGTNGATLTNLPAGVIDFRADGVAFANGGGLATTFYGNLTNQGTIKKSAGTAANGTTVAWAVTNSGTIQNNVAGTLNLTSGVTNTGIVTMVNGATIGGTITSNTNGSVQGPAGGIGTYTGLLTFNSGSTLLPGGGQAGELDINNNLAMSSGATYFVRLGGTTPVTGYSRTRVSGTVSLGNATLAGDTTGYNPAPTDALFILLNSGSSPISGTFDNGAPIVAVGGFDASISYVGNFATDSITGGHDVVLYNFTPVPEPGSLGLVIAVTGFVGAWRLRRAARRVLPS